MKRTKQANAASVKTKNIQFDEPLFERERLAELLGLCMPALLHELDYLKETFVLDFIEMDTL